MKTLHCSRAECPGRMEVEDSDTTARKCSFCNNNLVPANSTPIRIWSSDEGTSRESAFTRALSGQQPVRGPSPVRSGALSLSSPSSELSTESVVVYGNAECIMCTRNGVMTDHLARLQESNLTRSTAGAIVKACSDADGKGEVVYKRNGADGCRGFMVGVLAVGSKTFVAISGEGTAPYGFKTIVGKQGCFFVEGVAATHSSAGGAKIDKEWLNEVRDRTDAPLFCCAAPKLLEYVIQKNISQHQSSNVTSAPGTLWAMTEMWCGPSGNTNRRNGVVYKSCHNCEQVLPMLLCLTKSINPKVVDNDGFELVLTKQQMKNFKAGRK